MTRQGLLFATLATALLHCGESRQATRSPLPAEQTAVVSPTRATSADAPFDIGRVVRQVHFAFRPASDGWRAEHATYAVHATAESFTVAPSRADETGHVIDGTPIRFATTAISTRDRSLLGAHAHGTVESDGHLAIDRGDAVESLRNGENGVEQSWAFAARPDGDDDVEVRVDVRDGAFLGETEHGLHFIDRATGLGVRYGHATWVDAHGTRTELVPRWDGREITMRVPARVVAQSTFPAVLDPTVSPEFGMDNPVVGGNVWQQTAPRVAAGGSAGWLVVWQDSRSVSPGIWGTRVRLDGTVADPYGIAIGTGSGTLVAPSVAFNGTNWLVAWEKDITGLEKDVFAARVSSAGTVLDSTPITITTSANEQMLPAVSSDGNQFFVVWQDHTTTSNPYNIRGAFISPAGVLTQNVFVGFSSAQQTNPAVAFNGTDYFVVWKNDASGTVITTGTRVSAAGVVANTFGDPLSAAGPTQNNPTIATNGAQFFVAWDEYRGATSYDIRGTRLSPAGAVLDGSGIVITNATGSQSMPSASWDGTNWILAWTDQRVDTTYGDIYGARVSPAGVVVDTSGFAICTQPQFQGYASLAFNGTQGLAAWADNRFANYRDIYAARIGNTGNVIDTTSFVLSTTASMETYPRLAFDGTNWLVVWTDLRRGFDYDVYGVRVSTSGTVLDPSGIAVSVNNGSQSYPEVAFNGTNWFVVWQDERNTTTNLRDIYGARVASNGTVLEPNGVAVASTAFDQALPRVGSDGSNWLVAWSETRSGNTDIYGARVSGAGTVLDATPFAICTAADFQSGADVVFSGAQYIVAWNDRRSTSRYDIYASRVTPAGAVLDPNGFVVSTAGGNKNSPRLAWNGTETLAVWYQDNGVNNDVYGSRITAAGMPGTPFRIGPTADYQYFPDAAWDGTNWIVVWQNQASGGMNSIYATRVSAAGTTLDPAGVLLTGTSPYLAHPSIERGVGNTTLLVYERIDPAVGYVERAFGRTLVWGGDPGAMCSTGADCTSGFCADGVCCMTACGGSNASDCQACSVAAGAAANGTCGPVRAAQVCRAAVAGGCDVAEACDGTALACPSDGFAANTVQCRASAGMCDVAETCTGSSAACPNDGFAANTVQCRASAGLCDVAETCTGSSAACPNDGFASNTVQCRASAGMCDVAETCTGSSAACPDDAFAANTVECRASAGMCDVAEICTGSSAACPNDARRPDGANCSDSLACNGAEICMTGTCASQAAPNCDDGDVCTADTCGEPGGCAHAVIAGCCTADSQCTDGDSCTSDHCLGNVCVFMPTACGTDAGDVADAADDAPDVADVIDDTAPTDATINDASTDVAMVDVVTDTNANDVVDSSAPDALADATTADAADVTATPDADRDARTADALTDARDEAPGTAQGCACRAGRPASSPRSGAGGLISAIAIALALTARRRRSMRG